MALIAERSLSPANKVAYKFDLRAEYINARELVPGYDKIM